MSEKRLHFFEAGVPVNLRLAQDWALNIDPRIIYSGDLDGNGLYGMDASFRFGATWRARRDLALSLALLARWREPIPVPILGVYWRPAHGRFRVDGLLPRYAEVSVRMTDAVSWFSMFHFEGMRWAARVTEDVERQVDVRRTEIRLQSGLRYSFFGPIGVVSARAPCGSGDSGRAFASRRLPTT